MDRGAIAYLCLETPREGQASHTHVHEIVNGLRAEGFRVDLIATRAGGAAAGSGMLARLLGYVAAQFRFALRLRQYHAIYMRAHFAALPASLLAALMGRPVVQEINGKPADILVTYPWLRPAGALIRASYRWQLRLATRIIAVTDGLAEWARIEAAHSRIEIVPNGANTTLFTPDGESAVMAGKFVVFVGGLVAWHGIATMLAATRLPEWPPDCTLLLIGDGVERWRLENVDAQDRVRWLGRQPYDVVPTYLRGAIGAICIIENPDDRSATGVAPIKLFEAMSCACPVIVSDLPFQAELVRREGTGLIIRMADPAALARGVRGLAADPVSARAMGARGAAYVRAHASWAARARETAAIIAEAIGDRR